MVFLFEALPFELTFAILFQHGGFDALESVLGRYCCWEFLKLMGATRRADLLCICRAVQLLDHPAHALFLLNYPPDSSIPENIRAWRVAERCCVGWTPDVQSVVLAMRAFLPMHPQEKVFPWLDALDLLHRKRSEAEWKALGARQNLGYKFTEWWWNRQKEAFFLERRAASMGRVIQSTARAEMERLLNALKRREAIAVREQKRRSVWVRMQREEMDRQIRENNRGGGKPRPKENGSRMKEGKGAPQVGKNEEKKTKPAAISVPFTSEDRKRIAETATAKHQALLHKVLSPVQKALENTAALDDHFDRVVKRIAALENRHPLIKWNLRLLLHTASEETGRCTWDTELRIQAFRWAVVEKPLESLLKLLQKRHAKQ